MIHHLLPRSPLLFLALKSSPSSLYSSSHDIHLNLLVIVPARFHGLSLYVVYGLCSCHPPFKLPCPFLFSMSVFLCFCFFILFFLQFAE
ncbi:hypothetical protein BC829DRAFT_385738 [Chytridium lagenaria]|nr:hypothetical protein BC829DRAFT_385738 [Chytridium lagenaria]